MNIELALSSALFILVFSLILSYSTVDISKLSLEANLDQIFINVLNELLNENSEYSIVSKIYRLPIMISENGGYTRINQPVEVFLNFDGKCEGLARNVSLRVYEKSKMLPLNLMNQSFCFDNFLKAATLSFPVNISPYSTKKFFIYFHKHEPLMRSSSFHPNTSSWVPRDGDSFTEKDSLNDWYRYNGSNGMPEEDNQTKIYGNSSISIAGNFDSTSLGLEYNPSESITGVSNGWFLRVWIFINDTSDISEFRVEISDNSEIIFTNISPQDLKENEWNLFERNISQDIWYNWINFNASNGIDFVRFYALNSTPTQLTIKVDGLRFEKPPLKILKFPIEEVKVINFEKLENLKLENLEKIFGYSLSVEVEDEGTDSSA